MNKNNQSNIVEIRESVSKHNDTIRCAIYTRKSTDEGLEQEFKRQGQINAQFRELARKRGGGSRYLEVQSAWIIESDGEPASVFGREREPERLCESYFSRFFALRIHPCDAAEDFRVAQSRKALVEALVELESELSFNRRWRYWRRHRRETRLG